MSETTKLGLEDLAGVGWTRRRFLTASSAAGLWALAPLSLRAASGFELLSVAYIEGSEELRSLRPAPFPLGPRPGREVLYATTLQAVPAAGLLMGDNELAGEDLRLTVHGLYPGLEDGVQATFDSVNLLTYFPAELFGGEAAAPVVAWGARGGLRPTCGAPVSFPVPLRVDGGLDLVLEVVAPRPRRKGSRPVRGDARPSVQRLGTSFTVDPIAGQPKLQRGVYLLGLAPRIWDQSIELDGEAEPNLGLTSLVVSLEAWKR